MLETEYLYFYLLIFTMAYPVAQSFEKRLSFYKSFRSIILASAVMMLLFIPWDIAFTYFEVWSFNYDYTVGFRILGLPIEEWLFFICVPFACLFIYRVLIYFMPRFPSLKISSIVTVTLGFVLCILALWYKDQAYTSITFGLAGLGCIVVGLWQPYWISAFLVMYAVSWIPFLLVNGALTGNFTASPVVSYHPEEIIGLRVTTIPIEDSVYNLLMLLIVVAVYETWSPTRLYKRPSTQGTSIDKSEK